MAKKTATTKTDELIEFHREQRDYVIKQELEGQKKYSDSSHGDGVGLVDDEHVVAGMRSVRYTDDAHASADLIDNAIEAGATQVHITFHVDKKMNIDATAHLDDGSGVMSEFMRHAVRWGASSRQGRRNTFGRFGNGLSSASVNRGTRFVLFSRIDSTDPFCSVELDLNNLPRDKQGNVCPPDLQEDQALPLWLIDYCEQHFAGGVGALRTAVVWEDLDRPAWNKVPTATHNYLDHLGVTYAGWKDVVRIFVQGELVEPVDVLFTTPGCRYYDVAGAPGATPVLNQTVPIADIKGTKHDVTVRVSWMNVDAYAISVKKGDKGRPPKVRQKIRTYYNGIFVTRNGRFIELVQPEGFGAWNPYMRQVAISIDFPPSLDEIFGVTPDKQTIVLNPRIMDALDGAGVITAVRQAYREVDLDRAARKHQRDVEILDQGAVRPSEVVMDKVDAINPKRRSNDPDDTGRPLSVETREEAKKALDRHIKEVAADTGVDEDVVREAQQKRMKERPYRVELISGTDDQPFYQIEQIGPQSVLKINTGHGFYTDLYDRVSPEDAEVRSALEVLLWALGTTELDASGERRAFYLNERAEWSRRLAIALNLHPQIFKRTTSKKEAREDDLEGWEVDDDSETTPEEPVE